MAYDPYGTKKFTQPAPYGYNDDGEPLNAHEYEELQARRGVETAPSLPAVGSRAPQAAPSPTLNVQNPPQATAAAPVPPPPPPQMVPATATAPAAPLPPPPPANTSVAPPVANPVLGADTPRDVVNGAWARLFEQAGMPGMIASGVPAVGSAASGGGTVATYNPAVAAANQTAMAKAAETNPAVEYFVSGQAKADDRAANDAISAGINASAAAADRAAWAPAEAVSPGITETMLGGYGAAPTGGGTLNVPPGQVAPLEPGIVGESTGRPSQGTGPAPVTPGVDLGDGPRGTVTNPPPVVNPVAPAPPSIPDPVEFPAFTEFGPGNDLRTLQINPTPSDRLNELTGMSDTAAKAVGGGKSRGEIAQGYLDAFDARAEPMLRDRIRSVGQQAAKFGRLGMGDTAVEALNPYTDYLKERAALSSELASDSASGDINDRLNNLSALDRYRSGAYGEERSARDELRGERGREDQLVRDAIEDSIRQWQLETGQRNTEFNQGLSLSGLGYGNSPANLLFGAGQQYGGSANAGFEALMQLLGPYLTNLQSRAA